MTTKRFKMNDRNFIIKTVNQEQMYKESNEVNDGKGTYFGKFLPHKQEIWLDENLTKEQRRKTLMHELIHCYIWCYMTPFESFNEEDVCNIGANSHDVIERILEKVEEYDNKGK